MATTYPTGTKSDYDADDSVNTNIAETLRDIGECMIRKPFFVYFTEATRTNTAYGSMNQWEQFLPEYWVGRTVKLVLDGKVDAGTGTWCVVDVDDADAIISDEVDITVNGYDDTTATITVPSAWTLGTVRTLAIHGKATSGDTIYLKNENKVRMYCTD